MASGFDLCILGAGPAGFAAAVRARDLGKRVALVEPGRVGGTGLHEGALSSKTMWHLSNDYARSRRTGRGFKAEKIDVSYRSVTASVDEAVGERRALLCKQLELMTADIELVAGAGKFVAANRVKIEPSGREIEADYFLIATGSTPRLLPGVDVDGEVIVTSDHIEGWNEFPGSMVVVGSGVVGCEYATIFGHYGQTAISMIDRRERILPFEDEDVAECVTGCFEDMGVRIHKRAQLQSLVRKGDGVEYVIDCGGDIQTHQVDRALISIGRVPRVNDLGLEAAGVELGKRGGVRSDGTRTSVPHIFAAGDATCDVALANVAEMEGRHAVETMFDEEPVPIRYDALSTIMFLEPEVASVGLGEQKAREDGIPYRAARLDNRLISRNVAMRNTTGFIKLLASPDHKLLGLRVVGPQASSCIQGIALLMDLGADLRAIDHCVHPHPAVTEGVQECARLLLGRSLLKPELIDGATVIEYQP
ncbi:MAG: NAD(P)/FAD-dependent oxidoreductase [Deltaproteobacteria bacterium]|nr:NAD(P)/FAD-dependent oxidoreductase [Deltaproteobacteria bacterium]